MVSKVARKRDPHRCRKGNCEKRVEPGLSMFMQSAHVTDCIHGGCDPQYGGDAGEKKPGSIHSQKKRNVREDLPDIVLETSPSENSRNHGQDNRSLKGSRNESEGFPQVLSAFSGPNDSQNRDQRYEKGKKGTNVLDHCRRRHLLAGSPGRSNGSRKISIKSTTS